MLYGEIGLTVVDERRATAGYTIFTPTFQRTTYLVNMRGNVVHQWELADEPGHWAYLLPNGNLLSAVKTAEGPHVAAKGGLIQELDWSGNVVWEYVDHTQHHDFQRLANGNTIYIGLEPLPDEVTRRIQGGRTGTEQEGGVMMGDYLREVSPDGETVWEWHAHEELEIDRYPICPICSRGEFGHTNSVAEAGDGNILISWRPSNLVARIDKKTKKFAWEMQSLQFGHQHDFQETDAGTYILFANGNHNDRGGPNAGSQIIEIDPKSDEIVWTYTGNPPHTFSSPHISGCQRLSSGNTLICEGNWGRLFEVTPAGEIVWNYVSPYFMPADHPSIVKNRNFIFRCQRYAADSPEIGGRLNQDAWAV